jgi:hypothetical protein
MSRGANLQDGDFSAFHSLLRLALKSQAAGDG